MRRERNAATAAFLACQPVDAVGPAPEQLVVCADGGRVQTRQEEPTKRWKEDKIGVVYDAVPTPEQPGVPYHGPKPITRSIVATMNSWGDLGDGFSALAERRGGWRIGLTIIESTVKQVGLRVKGADTRWGSAHADEILHVLARLYSNDGAWDAFWESARLAA